MKNLFAFLTTLAAMSLIGCAHGHSDHKDGHHKKGHHHHKHKCKGHFKKMWKKMDADGDGAVTKAEFDKFYNEKFTKMDADGDGKITKEEKKAYKKSRKGKKKGCC